MVVHLIWVIEILHGNTYARLLTHSFDRHQGQLVLEIRGDSNAMNTSYTSWAYRKRPNTAQRHPTEFSLHVMSSIIILTFIASQRVDLGSACGPISLATLSAYGGGGLSIGVETLWSNS
jgi:hypothetical protein